MLAYCGQNACGRLEVEYFLSTKASMIRPFSSEIPTLASSPVQSRPIQNGKTKTCRTKNSPRTTKTTKQDVVSASTFCFVCDDSDAAEKIVKKTKFSELQAICDTMKENLSDSEVQRRGCEIIWNLSENNVARALIAQVGGIKAICAAMNAHITQAEVQESGCGAITSLTVNSRENKEKVCEEGGTDAICKAMKIHVSNAVIQRNGSNALKNLANADNIRGHLAKASGVEVLCDAVKEHLNDSEIQKQGLGALTNLAQADENKSSIIKLGGVKAASLAMRTHLAEAEIQISACGLFTNLTIRNHMAPALICLEGGIQAVCKAMSFHDTNIEVQRKACQSLCNFVYSDFEVCDVIEKEGGAEALRRALKTFGGDTEVMTHARSVVEKLEYAQLKRESSAKKEKKTAVIDKKDANGGMSNSVRKPAISRPDDIGSSRRRHGLFVDQKLTKEHNFQLLALAGNIETSFSVKYSLR